MNYFTDSKINFSNLDVFIRRRSIFNAIKWALPYFGKSLLDIGCGKMPYKNEILENSRVESYVGLDIDSAITYDEEVIPDFRWDGKVMPFEDNTFDSAFATEVLEHCPNPEIILAEIFRVIKDDGCFFFTVPFIWNLHEVPHDEFRYTPFSLNRLLAEAGFEKIEIYTSGGWDSYLAQAIATWIKRSSISQRKKVFFSFLLKPLIKKLYSRDLNKKISFKDGQMITDLYGIAKK